MQTSGPPAPASLSEMAVRVAATSVEAGRRRKTKKRPAARRRPVSDSIPTVSEDVLESAPEYSLHIELDITADFEGRTNKASLIRKVKAEILSAVKNAMTESARSLNLKSSGATVRPIRLECDINDA